MPSKPPALKARRVQFTLPTGARKHYAGDDLVMSHFMAMLSAAFPEGEDFFIRSVRNYRDQITDPELQQAVKGFIAQEATHRHQHRMLNERLQDMGYPTERMDRHVTWLLAKLEKMFSTEMALAGTAALEHYTATLAELLLTDDEMLDLLDRSDVRQILLWHAFEECEHKAVAFDVYQAAGGTERTRVRAMRIATVIFLVEMVIQTVRSMARDRASYNPRRLLRSLNDFRKSPLLSAETRRRIAAYTRPGFHPNDWDSTELLDRWSKELFDADGTQLIQAQ
ncbi:metal-dependent hydrolase [Mycobacterium kyorinense]|uniref:Metal-dependent hydrolase n=1 Tax=Mycobacterium kyorinense TaxID=487514 RepID=A0A1A2ZC95_9MYCO|nr:metal-dependent hydrolase [Mycobacterium kyorinense]OBI47288.1 metal-dependent hydrolase [Mycobacterium kyorinense]